MITDVRGIISTAYRAAFHLQTDTSIGAEFWLGFFRFFIDQKSSLIVLFVIKVK